MHRRKVFFVAAALAAAITATAGVAAPAGAQAEGEATGLEALLNLPVIGGVGIPPTPYVSNPPGGDEQVTGLDVPGAAAADILTAASGPSANGSQSSASVAGLTALEAVPLATTTADLLASSCDGDAGGTTVLNASVLGIPVSVPVPPNTGLSVPAVATAMVNEQTPSANGITVRAVHIALPVLGGEMILAESVCSTVAGADGGGGPVANVTSGTPNLAG
jgi:hypothetical protein